MEIKANVIGNLTADAVITDTEKNAVRLQVAVNSKDKTQFVSCFVYGVGDKRLNLLKKGTLVSITGNLSTSIYCKDKENLATAVVNLTIFVNDLEILFVKPSEHSEE